MPEIIEIDGSMGEGGGQILRTAFSLAALQGKPIKIRNIRSGRTHPGLNPQHLTSLQALAGLCNADMEGASRGSKEVSFFPGQIKDLNFSVNIGTAGSIALLIQQLLPVALKAKARIRIGGGTNVGWSPPVEFMQYVLFPILKKMGAGFDVNVSKRGYYPKGKGVSTFSSRKAKFPLKPINLDNFKGVQEVSIFSHSSDLPKYVSTGQASAAKTLLRQKFPDVAFNESIDFKEQSDTIGSGITLIALDSNKNALSGSALGRKGTPAETIGRDAAEKLCMQIAAGKAVDSFASDQLIPFMALAKGRSTIYCAKLSKHCVTNIAVCEKLLSVKFDVKGAVGKPAEISVEGAAFT